MDLYPHLGIFNPIRAGLPRLWIAIVFLGFATLAGPACATDSASVVVEPAMVARLAKDRAPEPLIFLDASSQEIHQRVKLTGSPRASELDAAKHPLPLTATLVIYDFSLGQTGATEAARAFLDAGYKSVHTLRGGFAAARDAKLSLDTLANPVEVMPYAVSAQSLASALKKKEELVLVDLRSEIEYSAGHIPGAINVKPTEVLAKAAAWGKSGWVVLYDTMGNSLDPLIWQLRKAGYLQTVSLTGGYQAWDGEQSPGSPVAR